jgi:GIY-YIG catalytic domain
MHFLDENWGEVHWTSWIPFTTSSAFKQLPTLPGLYRIRAVNGKELFYVGETGRNLRERIRSLCNNTMKETMPYNDPHTAAPSLWAWRHADGLDFECSAAPVSFAEDGEEARRLREGFKFYLLWQYRLEFGSSTRCNHGRFHPRYKKSTDREQGVQGYRLDEHEVANPAGGSSLPTLQFLAEPVAPNWMGLPWTDFFDLSSILLKQVPLVPGVYKLIDLKTGRLIYIGESSNLQKRIRTHARKPWIGYVPAVSYVQMSDNTQKYQLREIENDLIAGFYLYAGHIPKFNA